MRWRNLYIFFICCLAKWFAILLALSIISTCVDIVLNKYSTIYSLRGFIHLQMRFSHQQMLMCTHSLAVFFFHSVFLNKTFHFYGPCSFAASFISIYLSLSLSLFCSLLLLQNYVLDTFDVFFFLLVSSLFHFRVSLKTCPIHIFTIFLYNMLQMLLHFTQITFLCHMKKKEEYMTMTTTTTDISTNCIWRNILEIKSLLYHLRRNEQSQMISTHQSNFVWVQM